MQRLEIEISEKHKNIVEKYLKHGLFSTVEKEFCLALELRYEKDKFLLQKNDLEELKNELKKVIGGPFNNAEEFYKAVHKFIYPEFENKIS